MKSQGGPVLFFRSKTLPETNIDIAPAKMDGWKTILSFWVSAYFQGRFVSFREGIGSSFRALLHNLSPFLCIFHRKLCHFIGSDSQAYNLRDFVKLSGNPCHLTCFFCPRHSIKPWSPRVIWAVSLELVTLHGESPKRFPVLPCSKRCTCTQTLCGTSTIWDILQGMIGDTSCGKGAQRSVKELSPKAESYIGMSFQKPTCLSIDWLIVIHFIITNMTR